MNDRYGAPAEHVLKLLHGYFWGAIGAVLSALVLFVQTLSVKPPNPRGHRSHMAAIRQGIS